VNEVQYTHIHTHTQAHETNRDGGEITQEQKKTEFKTQKKI